MKNWTSRVLPPNRTILNSLNYEGIAVIELQFYHFPDSDRLRVGSVTDQIVWMIRQLWWSVNHCEITTWRHRASPTLPQLLWMLPETPYVLYMQLQHQGNSYRNGAIKHERKTNQIHGGIISRLFFIHFMLHALALHLAAVKILLQIFLYEDLSTLALHTSVGCISLQNASRTALCYATNTIKWKHS